MISANNISKSYAGQDVLVDVSFFLNLGQKVAIVGSNGSGKSTLLKILAGLEEPDSGNVQISAERRLGYLPQEIVLGKTGLTIERYLKEFVGIAELEDQLEVLAGQLDDPEKAEEYSNTLQLYMDNDGYDFDHTMAKVLAGLGLAGIEPSRQISTLSGGQRSKVALAGTLLQGKDVLLLDEPTNNLDLPSIVWLESFLSSCKAACLIVSHDRYFLDKIVSKVFEIDWYDRNLVEYAGNYSCYIDRRLAKMRRDQLEHERQKDEIVRLEESARQIKSWSDQGSRQDTRDNDKFVRGAQRDRSGKSAAKAKAIEQQISGIKLVKLKRDREPTIIPLAPKHSEADTAIRLRRAVVGYKDGFALEPVSLEIGFGQRIGFIGKNGTGKSTLLRTITGELSPISGIVRISPSVVFGNLTQTHGDMPRNMNVLDFLRNGSLSSITELYHVLANFNFTPEAISTKEIGEISPGERARLAMSLFSLNSANVLVLDEPTNHLDVDALDALEKVLSTYKGTVIFVSHDRHFLETISANKLFMIEDGSVKELSDLQSYLESIGVDKPRGNDIC